MSDAQHQQTTPIRIAIIGGGLAGASLIHALLPHSSHLDVHIFESAPEFREAGMAVGLARNAQAALDLIGRSAVEALERAGAVPMNGVRILMGEGNHRGEVVDKVDVQVEKKRLTSIVHRADLLKELLAPIPRSRMHASKKLDKIENKEDATGTLLHFTDGSAHPCDIVIGCDGIRSLVRRHIGAPPASNTGAWAIMSLQPYERVRSSSLAAGGHIDAGNPGEYGWCGDSKTEKKDGGTFLMHNILSGGTLVQLAVCGYDNYDDNGKKLLQEQWRRTVTNDELRDKFRTWPDHLRRGVEELLMGKEEEEEGGGNQTHEALYLWDHDPAATTYVSGSVCVAGDAAHATTPWQGSGAGMAIEDSLILSTLLGRANSPESARRALGVYDRQRRPRTQRIVESSRVTGQIMSGAKGMGMEQDLFGGGDGGKWGEMGRMFRRWDFILDLDVEAHRDEALGEFLKGEAEEKGC